MKILHIDIETAPNKVYSWGLFKQNIAINQIVEPGYTLCFAAKWEGDKKVYFHSIQDDGVEGMLTAAWELINEADVVVHYNGTRFDMPTLNREFVLNDYLPPAPYQQVDLLKVVRKQFRFPSNKLDYVAQALGLGGKAQHKGMELWHQCMEGEEKAWKVMKAYNKQDVVLTQSLYTELLPWIEAHPNHALYKKTDGPVCPTCGGSHLQRRGTYKTKTQVYQRFQCNDCGSWTRTRFTALDKDKREHVLTGVQL